MIGHVAAVKTHLLNLQDRVRAVLEAEDGKTRFAEDAWERPVGDGGRTRVTGDGALVEKDGVNFPHVFDNSLLPSVNVHRSKLAGRGFQALGVPPVIHPENPHVSTSYANVCFLCTEKKDEESIQWFGSGFDPAPYYAHEGDHMHWYRVARDACTPLGADAYPHYKEWCDRYLHLKHRNEPHGIGGLFFGDLNQRDFDACSASTHTIGDAHIDVYLPIVQHRRHTSLDERQRESQAYRRGRYVEFNLVFDRSTLLGSQSGGRTESILMSLSSQVCWSYDWKPEPGSEEARLTEYLFADRD